MTTVKESIRIMNPSTELKCKCVDSIRYLIDVATEFEYDFVIVDGHPVATVHGVDKLDTCGYPREAASMVDSGITGMQKIYHPWDCEIVDGELIERSGYYPQYRWLFVPLNEVLTILDQK